MRVLGVTASLALVLALAGPTPLAAASGTGSIAGHVTDLEGHAESGITVTVWTPDIHGMHSIAETTTDATGAFMVDGVLEWPYYKVRFSDPTAELASEYYANAPVPEKAVWVAVVGGVTTDGIDAMLEPAATIAGRLTNGLGLPVTWGGAAVRLVGGLLVEVSPVDDDGRYSFGRLLPGSYILEFKDVRTGASEYWNNVDAAHATIVEVSAGAHLAGLDAQLGGQVHTDIRPTIAGVPRTGSPLKALSGGWQPAGTLVSYRWMVGADTWPFDDPTGPTYVPTVRDIGKTIRVQVTGTATLPGWLTGTAWSAPTTAVLPANAALAPPFVNLVRPRVKGILEVGHRVLVTPGQWEPTPARLTYQWYMGPQAIPGATHHRFLVRDAQLGARLWAKVTARVAWCAPTTVSTRRSEPVLP